MRIEVLGPLRVRVDGVDVTPRGPVSRALLVTLLIRANEGVRVDELTDLLWPDTVEGNLAGRLQVQVHRLRRLLGDDDRIAHGPGGYTLRIDADEWDLGEFDALAEKALASGDEEAARAALVHWRGEPLDDVVGMSLEPELQRWILRRLALLESLARSELVGVQTPSTLAELEVASRRFPMREGLQALLMAMLHRAGQTSQALEVFTRTRGVMVDELGIEPGQELQSMQARILAGEPTVQPLGQTTAPVPAQLPTGGAQLFGRDVELSLLDKLTTAEDSGPGGARLVVVSGTAGSGKTALVVHWARRRLEDFPDGQFFTDLRGFDTDPPLDPGEVLGAHLRALGADPRLVPASLHERAAMFRSMVAGRRLLLVVDNARSVTQVLPLLPSTENAVVIVTSRDTLSGLAVSADARFLEVERIGEADALELLARLGSDDVRRQPALAARVAAQCAHLPLALRIAAEQLRNRPAFDLARLAEEIDDERGRLDLFAGDDPATDVRAVLGCSVDALPDEASAVFLHLGLLPGSDVGLDALAALCGSEPHAMRRAVNTLLRAHLVEETADRRYGQHDLLRVYARELAATRLGADERNAARARLMDWYAAATGTRVASDALAWLEADHANVLAAVDALGDDHPTQVVQLSHDLGPFLRDQGHLAEALRLHQRAASAAVMLGDASGEAGATNALGALALIAGELADAHSHFARCLDLHDSSGSAEGRAGALGNLALVAQSRGDEDEARRLLEAALSVGRAQGSVGLVVSQLLNLADLEHLGGRVSAARSCVEEAIVLSQEHGLRHELGVGMATLAAVVLDLDEVDAAWRVAEEAVEIGVETRKPEVVALGLRTRAAVLHARGDSVRASDVATRALTVARGSGDLMCVIRCLITRGQVLCESSNDEARADLNRAVDLSEAGELVRFAEQAHSALADLTAPE